MTQGWAVVLVQRLESPTDLEVLGSVHPLDAFLEEPVISKICSVSAHSEKEWKIAALIIIISIISMIIIISKCSLGTITVWKNDCITGPLLLLIQ